MIPEVGAALKVFCEAGLMAAGQDYDRGGMQLPCVVEKAGFAYFKAANVGTVVLSLPDHRQCQHAAANAARPSRSRPSSSRCWKAVSSAPCACPNRRRARACPTSSPAPSRQEPTATSYRITGNKMWISAGEHELAENIVHLVLAKMPGPDGKLIPGVKGISLFIVPKKLVNEDGSLGERNDVVLAGLNHKMGYRGTTNCLLNFGEGKFRPQGRAGAIGYLVGEVHKGLANMFHMMNEARIGVGLGAVVLGYTGYLHALDYARNRPQGRHPMNKDPAKPQLTIVEHTDVQAHAAGAEVLCRRRPGAGAVLLAAGRRAAHRHRPGSGEGSDAAAGRAHAHRQVLAVAVVPGGEQPRDPGAWRLRLHPRIQRRAVLPRQPAQPDPRRHPRHTGPGPAGPQGDHAGRRGVQGVCESRPAQRRARPGDPVAGGRCACAGRGIAAHRGRDRGAVRGRRHEQDAGQRRRSTWKPSATRCWPGSGSSRRW